MLSPRFLPESIFYTQSVMPSPRFVPSPQSVVRSPCSIVTGSKILPINDITFAVRSSKFHALVIYHLFCTNMYQQVPYETKQELNNLNLEMSANARA